MSFRFTFFSLSLIIKLKAELFIERLNETRSSLILIYYFNIEQATALTSPP